MIHPTCTPIQIVHDQAPFMDDPSNHFPFIRVIGIKEIGLMTVYATAVATNDVTFMALTGLGRLFTVPLMTTLVFAFDAPLAVLSGITQDILFGSWTCYEWYKIRNDARHAFNNQSINVARSCIT
jgi:hypothetical protein